MKDNVRLLGPETSMYTTSPERASRTLCFQRMKASRSLLGSNPANTLPNVA